MSVKIPLISSWLEILTLKVVRPYQKWKNWWQNKAYLQNHYKIMRRFEILGYLERQEINGP